MSNTELYKEKLLRQVVEFFENIKKYQNITYCQQLCIDYPWTKVSILLS